MHQKQGSWIGQARIVDINEIQGSVFVAPQKPIPALHTFKHRVTSMDQMDETLSVGNIIGVLIKELKDQKRYDFSLSR